MKKVLALLLILVITGGVMFGFSGCTKAEKYKVEYNNKYFLQNAKDYYKAGKKVKIIFEERGIATDTDYSFYLDGERLNPLYEQGKGYIIEFVMPDHDVKFECMSVNSMIRDYDVTEEADE